jgi:hypothetical protein
MLARHMRVDNGPPAPPPAIRYGPDAAHRPSPFGPTFTGRPRAPRATSRTAALRPRWCTSPVNDNPADFCMGDVLSKIDPDLRLILGSLEDHDELTALLVPCDAGPSLRMLLAARRHEGRIEYHVLRLANAIEVTGDKTTLLELAACAEVTRVRPAGGFLHGE